MRLQALAAEVGFHQRLYGFVSWLSFAYRSFSALAILP
jgi:hypothetical protein